LLIETPWTCHVVWIPHLLNKLDLQELEPDKAVDLLRAMSDLIRYGGLHSGEELLPHFEFSKGKPGERHRRFVEGVLALSDADRDHCCFHSCHPEYELRDGTPVPEIVSSLYGSEVPIGAIETALVYLKSSGAWSVSPAEWPDAGSKFYRCDALTFEKSSSAGESHRITPLLYLGSHDPVDALEIWEAQEYIGALTRAYRKTADSLQNEWLRTVPSAAAPDPVFTFINEPSRSRAASALVWVSASFERLRIANDSREPEHSKQDHSTVSGPNASVSCETTTQTRELCEASTETVPKSSGPWHKTSEAPPEDFHPTPLRGTKQNLARWIVAASGDSRRDRALNRKLLDDDGLWGRKSVATGYEVFFRDPRRFAEANRLRLSDESLPRQ